LTQISPQHFHAFVPRLLHDVPLLLAALGGRGSKTSAQGMAAKLFGITRSTTGFSRFEYHTLLAKRRETNFDASFSGLNTKI
jgi:hypothetical protein